MVLERENFIIEYDESIEYIFDLVYYLESNMNEIIEFFSLDSLSSKKRIIVYNDLELYKKHIEQYFPYQDYMCADTNDGNINILSLEAARSTKTYSDIGLDKLKYTILHEFVHICQQECAIEKEEVIWFWEALATNLGNPDEYEEIVFDASDEDIINFNNSSDNYPIAFTIGRYMLENYSHEEILEYIKYPSKLLNHEKKILEDARNWSKRSTL